MKEFSSDYQELLECALCNNQDTIAITDYNSVEVFPKVERFVNKNHIPIKVIYGAKVSMLTHNEVIPVTILVRNQIGLKNLYKIISLIKTDNLVHFGKQVITQEEMVRFSEGLLYGLELFDRKTVYENLSKEEIGNDMLWYDFLGVDGSKCKEVEKGEEYIKRMLSIAKKYRKIVVATGNIGYSPKSEERYLKRVEEMLQDLSFLESTITQELVFDNTRKIASLIATVEIMKKKVSYPKIKNSKEMFIKQIYENAHRLYDEKLPQIVEERLQEELYGKEKDGVLSTESESIFLIYKDLVEASKKLGYPVLPRGYVASSFLAYLIGITNINPLPSHYHCLTCGYSEFRNEKEEPYSSIYACGFDMPNKKCPNCKKLMKQDGFTLSSEMFLNSKHVPTINLNFALNIRKTLQNDLEKSFGEKNVIRAGVIGCTKNGEKRTGQHPGGFFLVPKDLSIYDFTPIAYPCDGVSYKHKVTHFDYHDLENDLLSFNLLGHPVLDELKSLEDRTKRKASSIPLNDKETFQFLSSGETDELFEFSKPLAKELLKKRKPSTFNELINILGIVHNEEENKTIDSLEFVFREELYEYLLQKKMPKTLAYSITKFVSNGGRKEKLETWKQHKQTMKEYKVEENLIKRFQNIRYLVSKAHCTSYAIFAFQLSWYKVHYPKIFAEVIEETK